MSQRSRILDCLLLFSIFFPYLGILQGADVQPTFILLASIFFILIIKKTSLSAVIFLIMMLLLGLLVFLSEFDNAPSKLILVYVVSLLTPFFIFTFLSNGKSVVSLKFVYAALFIYISTGVIQLFYPEFLSFLITRDNTEQLLASGRGVKSLTGEPSQFGRVLVLLNIVYLFERIIVLKSVDLKSCLRFSFFLIVVNVILTRSFYAFSIHLMLVMFFSYYVSKRYLLFFVIVSILGLTFTYNFIDQSSRFYIILNAISTNPDFIFSQGAIRRVLNVPISIYASYQYGLLGAGFSGSNLLISSLPFFGYEIPFAILGRNLGGFVEFYLRIGILSLPFFTVYFYYIYKCCFLKIGHHPKLISIGCFFAFSVLFLTLFDGSPSDPMKWYVFIYICMFFRHSKTKLNQ